MSHMSEKILVIENVRSAHNVGSLFRSADGAAVSKIFLYGYTPTPTDRFGRVQKEIHKTSLGAVDSISWAHIPTEEILVSTLSAHKKSGYILVALEQTPQSIPLRDFVVPEKVVYIVGNEIDGVSRTLLGLADAVVEIPMKGIKESLNVSVAGGILLFHNT
jgi:23S rRNA (guanosine2251-2'-O)-methyltransferase